MKLGGVLNYHIGMCILSGIYVWAKIVEMRDVRSRFFFSKFGSDELWKELDGTFNNVVFIAMHCWDKILSSVVI